MVDQNALLRKNVGFILELYHWNPLRRCSIHPLSSVYPMRVVGVLKSIAVLMGEDVVYTGQVSDSAFTNKFELKEIPPT